MLVVPLQDKEKYSYVQCEDSLFHCQNIFVHYNYEDYFHEILKHKFLACMRLQELH